MASVSILGAGSWGTALAIHVARHYGRVTLWGRDQEHMRSLARHRANQRYLPDIRFPAELELVSSLDDAMGSDLVVIATPSHAFGEVAEDMVAGGARLEGLAWASKGFEPGTGRLLHEVANELLGASTPGAVITGPSFAKELALGLPTAVTVASRCKPFATQLVDVFHGGSMRAYTSSDIVGAELGGAVKNVMAIATGISDGMQLGDNARAALITRGLAEIMRLGEAMGAQRETLVGLAGMGDLVLTCTGDLSRNRRFGLALGREQGVEEALESIGQVVEGVSAAKEVTRLARQHQIEMPISEQVLKVVEGQTTPRAGLKTLLSRQPKAENISPAEQGDL